MKTLPPTQYIFNQVMDFLDHAVVICDVNGKFTYWNNAAKSILANYDNVKNDPDWPNQYGMFHLDGQPYDDKEVPLIKAIKGVTTKEKMLVKNSEIPQGTYIEVNSAPILSEQNEIIGGVASFKDITHSIKTEQFVADLTMRLKHLADLIKNDFYSSFDLVPGLTKSSF